MNQNKKLSTWYFLLIMAFVLLGTLIFLVMNKIESITTRLESRIYKRNLGYIVDKDYEVKKEKHDDKPIEVLNELTDFFFLFHENTVTFNQQLSTFMAKRDHVIYRFNSSSINIYDLTVVPNKEVKHYDLKEHILPPEQHPADYIKQIPFSRQLKFKHSDYRRFKSKMYFMCTARLSVSAAENTVLHASFMSTNDVFDERDIMEYKISKTKINITMNRIIYMKSPRNFRIFLKGYTNSLLRLHMVEAYCMNFNDVTNEEVQKIE